MPVRLGRANEPIPNRRHSHPSRGRVGRWLRRPVVRLGALITAVVTGVAINLLTGIGQRIAPEVSEGSRPFAVSVVSDQTEIDAFANMGFAEVIPLKSRERVSPPRSVGCSGFHVWAQQHSGAEVEETRFRLILQGRTERALILTSLRVRLLGADRAGKAASFSCLPAGQANIRALVLDLDHPSRSAAYRTKNAIKPFGFTLAKGETEVFDVIATTHSPKILRWNAVLDYTLDGRAGSVEIQDRGRPFRTTAFHAATGYAWAPDKSEWVRRQ